MKNGNIALVIIVILVLVGCKNNGSQNTYADIDVTLALMAEQKIKKANIQEATDWLLESKKTVGFEINEAEINALGYRLLYDLNKPQEAIKIFDINVELHPNSANAYDSAAEGLFVANDYPKSVEYYRKAIQLNGSPQFHQLGYKKPNTYIPTKIPFDPTELFEQRGNWKNEIAFVYVQGGPDLQLNIGPRDGLHLMPNHTELLKIYPYQGQMLNPAVLTTMPTLTKEQSAFENGQSVEILDRVIKYLVEQKKKVFLIGHSYGSSICMEYIHTKENQAEKVVLMGLDLDEDISSWETLKTGEYIRWREGQTPYARAIFGNIPMEHPVKSSFDRVADNLTMLVKNNMAKKYTELYKAEDFKKIISVYSNQDEANGRKSAEEIAILQKKGTTIVEIEGDHHDMLFPGFMTALYEHLINGTVIANRY